MVRACADVLAGRLEPLRGLMSHQGRLGRSEFVRHVAKAYLLFVGLAGIGIAAGSPAFLFPPSTLRNIITATLFFPFAIGGAIAFCGILLSGMIRRCHDAGFSAWWMLLSFPLLMPSAPGVNAYGPPP